MNVYCCDGADFVVQAAAAGTVSYDVVIVDVFDGEGRTPEAKHIVFYYKKTTVLWKIRNFILEIRFFEGSSEDSGCICQ